jgi:excinuclease ABC subunit A
VIKCADWIIDLGPDGGERGGEIVTTGTPAQVATVKSSYTGQYLKDVLAKAHGMRPSKSAKTKV